MLTVLESEKLRYELGIVISDTALCSTFELIDKVNDIVYKYTEDSDESED